MSLIMPEKYSGTTALGRRNSGFFLAVVQRKTASDNNGETAKNRNPGIRASAPADVVQGKDVDGRDKPGYDDYLDDIFVSECHGHRIQ
jgi:hypothetical protein